MKDYYKMDRDIILINLHIRCEFGVMHGFMLQVILPGGEFKNIGKVFFKDEAHLLDFIDYMRVDNG